MTATDTTFQQGSVQQAFIGDFTPEGVFVPLDPFSHIIDWGKDLYAAQTFYNAGPEAVMIAWAGNWDCELGCTCPHEQQAKLTPPLHSQTLNKCPLPTLQAAGEAK